MDERQLWDARTPCRPRAPASPTGWFVAPSAFLNSVTRTTLLSLHSSAECYPPSSSGTESVLACWGFPFLFLITTCQMLVTTRLAARKRHHRPLPSLFVCSPGMVTTWRWGMRDVCDDTSGWDSKFCGFWKNKEAVPLFCYRIYVSCTLDSVLKLLF